MIAVDQGMAPVPGTESTNTHNNSLNEKKPKKRPIRRSGHWCEFLSSKGKLYYFHIKKGITQWTKPESWNDEQAYEPVKKAPRVEKEPEVTKEPEVESKDEEQKWSTSLTSLKAKVRQKMETKNYQKDRKNKFLTEIDQIKSQNLNQQEVNLASMLPLTSYQSMGLELRELISEKTEKKANQLDKERIRGSNVNLLEINSKIALNKRQIQDSFKLLDYTNLRLKSFADNSSNNQS